MRSEFKWATNSRDASMASMRRPPSFCGIRLPRVGCGIWRRLPGDSMRVGPKLRLRRAATACRPSRSRACRISLRVSISSARIRSISSRAFEPSERRASSSAACSAIVASRCSSSICIRAAACSAAARRFSETLQVPSHIDRVGYQPRVEARFQQQHLPNPRHHRAIADRFHRLTRVMPLRRLPARKVGSPSTARRTRPSACSCESPLRQERLELLRKRTRRAALLAFSSYQDRKLERLTAAGDGRSRSHG